MTSLVRNFVSTVSGAEEFAYLLAVALYNYGTLISAGIYQHTSEAQDNVLEFAAPGIIRSDQEQDDQMTLPSHDEQGNAPEKSSADSSASIKACHRPHSVKTPAPSKHLKPTTHEDENRPKQKRLKVHKEPSNRDEKSSADAHEKELRETIRGMKIDVETDESVLDFSEISGLDSVKLALEEFACFFLHFPHLTRNLRQRSTTGILLFGPQGTGKTLVIRSFARKYNLTLFDIRASAIMSKFVGESEKFIKALFKEVRSSAPAVLMLDECDGLLCNPASDMTQSHSYRLLQNELKNQWSDLIYSRDEVIIIGATNKPHDIDMDGFGRRLSLKLAVTLPDEAGCQAMLKNSLSRVRHALDDDEVETLGIMCCERRLSGFDIDCLVEAQLRRAIRTITTASHFQEMEWDGESILVPCDGNADGAVEGPWTRLREDSERLSYPPFTSEEIHRAIERARPTVDESMAQRHASFADQYGTDG